MTHQLPPSYRPRHTADALWNFLSGLLVVAIIAVLVGAALIYVNPGSSLNPLPPPTAVPTLSIPTLPLPATLAPTSTTAPTSTAVPQITPTALFSPTAVMSTPGALPNQPTPTPTARVNSSYAFILQSEPRAIDASLFSPERGCQWMGVAGQAFDLNNNPVPLGIEVQLAGILDGKPISIISLTGTAVIYGSAGFEITLADKPVASRGSLWIRLVDQAGLPLSDRYYFDTYADCEKNLIIINFKQVR